MFFRRKKVEGDVKIVVDENTMSGRTEGYNRLKDNILYLNADGNTKVIQIESSLAHESKTTVCSNLAVSLGLTDKKVIVVDLDFRKPKVHQRLGVAMDNGMAEYMLGNIDKKDIIKATPYKNVDTITRGGKIHNSSLVLISEKFKNLIKELREEYDYVLLDCAPVLQVTDYIHICQVSDGVLFLVSYGQITRNQLADAIKDLRQNGANILGTVFTMYDSKKDRGYGYYGKGYYGKGYYGYYHNYLYEEEDETKSKKGKRSKKKVEEQPITGEIELIDNQVVDESKEDK